MPTLAEFDADINRRADALINGGGNADHPYEVAPKVSPSLADLDAYYKEHPVEKTPIQVNKGNPVKLPGAAHIFGTALEDAVNLGPNLVEGARAVPDVLHGLLHEPKATLKGFVQGASEAATPERLGTAALLAPGGAGYATRALLAAGGAGAADAAKGLTGSDEAPVSEGDALKDMLGAAALPGSVGVLSKAGPLVSKVLPTKSPTVGKGVAGGVLGATIGYRHGGVLTSPGIPGAIEGALEGGFVGNRLATSKNPATRALANLAGLGGEREEGAAAARTFGETGPNGSPNARSYTRGRIPTMDEFLAKRAAAAAPAEAPMKDWVNEPDLTGKDYAATVGTYNRAPEGYPGMATRAQQMGQQTIQSMRDAGYDVSPQGFRSSKDIDKLASGPDAERAASLAALRQRARVEAMPANPRAFNTPALPPGQYDMGPSSLDVERAALPPAPVRGELPPPSYIEAGPSSIEGRKALPWRYPEPSFEDIAATSVDKPLRGARGMVEPDAEVPDFEYEGGEWEPPPQEPVPASEVAPSRTKQQEASLKALMALPSFRGLR